MGNNCAALLKEISDLKLAVKDLSASVRILSERLDNSTPVMALTPERELAIKRVAAARAAGDKNALRMYNRQRSKELGLERVQGSRS